MGLLLSGVSTSAIAQQAADSDQPQADAIVVTGTRQDTPLKDAPIAATVLTERFVEDARIETVGDIDDYIPNVQFNQLGQLGGAFVTIRGVESNPFIVKRGAVYVDGIPFRGVQD